MALLEKQLLIKRSKIPGAGKGLFTKQFIAKGTRIIEYKGRITTWKEVLQGNDFNAYVYYVKRDYVIDAMLHKKALARYANDARGLSKIKGLTNNTKYVEDDKKVFMEAVKDIPACSEILVSYGKDYWNVVNKNERVNQEEKAKGKKK